MLLEVLENNKGAYKVYERLGFTTSRLLHAYKGNVIPAEAGEKITAFGAIYDIVVIVGDGDQLPPNLTRGESSGMDVEVKRNVRSNFSRIECRGEVGE